MDFITDPPYPLECTAVWVVVGHFSKIAHFILVPLLSCVPAADYLTSLFIKLIFYIYGLYKHIILDEVVQLTFKSCCALCRLLKIKLDFTPFYHPQANGQVECVNQILENYLNL